MKIIGAGCSSDEMGTAEFAGTVSAAANSEPHRHHHRSLSARRTHGPARARGRESTVGKARPDFHRGERERRGDDHRYYPRRSHDGRRPYAASSQSSDFRQCHALHKPSVRPRKRPATGHVPQSQSATAPACTAWMGSQASLYFARPQSGVQQVAGGQMKAYGITEAETSPQFSTAASLVKVLGPKLEILYWQALLAPAGTPDTIINRLNVVLQEIVSDPAILKTWAAEGVSPYPKDQRSPLAPRPILKSEIARWGQVIRDNDIHVDQGRT